MAKINNPSSLQDYVIINRDINEITDINFASDGEIPTVIAVKDYLAQKIGTALTQSTAVEDEVSIYDANGNVKSSGYVIGDDANQIIGQPRADSLLSEKTFSDTIMGTDSLVEFVAADFDANGVFAVNHGLFGDVNIDSVVESATGQSYKVLAQVGSDKNTVTIQVGNRWNYTTGANEKATFDGYIIVKNVLSRK
jgi:hypothetical protein